MKTRQKTFKDDTDPMEIYSFIDECIWDMACAYETNPRDPADRMCYTGKKMTIRAIID